MPLNLPAIRQALVDKAVIGVARSVTGYAYDPGSPALPAFIIRDVAVSNLDVQYPYHVTYGSVATGEVAHAFDIEVMVNAAGDLPTAQKILDEFRSVGVGMTNSVADVIEALPRTLGGLIADMWCSESSVPQVFQPENGDPAYLSSLFHIELLAGRA